MRYKMGQFITFQLCRQLLSWTGTPIWEVTMISKYLCPFLEGATFLEKLCFSWDQILFLKERQVVLNLGSMCVKIKE